LIQQGDVYLQYDQLHPSIKYSRLPKREYGEHQGDGSSQRARGLNENDIQPERQRSYPAQKRSSRGRWTMRIPSWLMADAAALLSSTRTSGKIEGAEE
jgi:hypothetical protein